MTRCARHLRGRRLALPCHADRVEEQGHNTQDENERNIFALEQIRPPLASTELLFKLDNVEALSHEPRPSSDVRKYQRI